MADKQCRQAWVDAREYKIILNLARVAQDPQAAMAQVWEVVAQQAKTHHLGANAVWQGEARQRRVHYLDTAQQALRNHGYIFRLRGNETDRRMEGTLKYRSEDFYITRGLDLSARDRVSECKFEQDFVPSRCSSALIIYQSRSNSVELTHKEATMPHFGRLRAVYPVLGRLGIHKGVPLQRVNAFQAEELAVKMEAAFALANGVKAAACFNFWRDIKNNALLVAEFSFACPVEETGLSPKTAQDAMALMQILKALKGWYDPAATTKTDLVYGGGGKREG